MGGTEIMSQSAQTIIQLEPPKMAGFTWWQSEHPAFSMLCELALDEFNAPSKRVKLQDRIDRKHATERLLAVLISQGREGLPVQIAMREHKVSKRPVPKLPRGHAKALNMLLDLGLVDQTIMSNPTGRLALAKLHHPKMAYPWKSLQRGKYKGAAGGYSLSEFGWAYLDACQFDDSAITIAPERLLSVKIKKSRIMPPEHPKREVWRNQLSTYNDRLTKHKFTISDKAAPPSIFMLRRAWNDEHYTLGGRFFSSFVNQPGTTRKTLKIDGVQAVHFDYSAMHARLSLAICGIHCPGDIDPRQKGTLAAYQLPYVKQVWNAGLNVTGLGVTSALSHSDIDLDDRDDITRDILDSIDAEFPGVQKAFGSGLRLQHSDAQAVEIFLEAFNDARHPLCPVHDGFYLHPNEQELFIRTQKQVQAAIYADLRIHWPRLVENELPLPMKS